MSETTRGPGRPVGSATKSYELDGRHRRRLRAKLVCMPKNSIARALIETRMLVDEAPATHAAIAKRFNVSRARVTAMEREILETT
jgi:DNA-directed RNA polymerase sigma subunit (sigma70/sigma32)